MAYTSGPMQPMPQLAVGHRQSQRLMGSLSLGHWHTQRQRLFRLEPSLTLSHRAQWRIRCSTADERAKLCAQRFCFQVLVQISSTPSIIMSCTRTFCRPGPLGIMLQHGAALFGLKYFVPWTFQKHIKYLVFPRHKICFPQTYGTQVHPGCGWPVV